MAGGFFGIVVNVIFPNITASAGAYSLVGMGALVSATTHGPLSAILILFEMTGDYKIILPLMIACIISSVFAGQLLGDSIYTLKLARRGINIRAGKEVNILKSIPVKEVMGLTVETVREELTLERLAEQISRSRFNSFPVVDSQGKLTGVISFLDYRDALYDENLQDLVVAKDLATTRVVTVSLDDSLYDALEKITLHDFSILPVVHPEDTEQLAGVLSRRDIMSAYTSAVIRKSVFNSKGAPP
jgi:CIC family chloride channel protein